MSEQFAEQADAVVDNDMNGADSEPSEILDEDRMESDPLEDGMDTAEGYSRTVRVGGFEDAGSHDDLAHRLPQEEPDVTSEVQLDVPIAERSAMDLDQSIDDPVNSVDGVGGEGVLDPLSGDGATEGEVLTEGDGGVELGLSSAAGANEETGLPADDSVGEVASMDGERGAEGAEQQALHVEQES